jgi:transcriptional regulator with XRE-family HTH domain
MVVPIGRQMRLPPSVGPSAESDGKILIVASAQRDRSFDHIAFFSALDAAREGRSLTWKKLADQAGVSQSTLTRMSQGRRPDVDSFAALLSWSGLEAEDFLVKEGSGKGAEPLAAISVLLRRDPNLSDEAASALDELVKATYQRLRKP